MIFHENQPLPEGKPPSFYGFPMVFQRFSDAFPMVFHGFPMGFPMVFLCFPMVSHGFPMVFHDCSMVFPWFLVSLPAIGSPQRMLGYQRSHPGARTF